MTAGSQGRAGVLESRQAIAGPILVHYHIYKNAGSTVDRAISAAVGADAFIEIDKVAPYKDAAQNLDLIRQIRRERPGMRGFASHTFVATAHQADDLVALPIVFLRHPLLRLASVYRFEAVSNAHKDTPMGVLAATKSFPEWLEAYLDHHNGKNYQTCVLSMNEDGSHSAFTNDHPGHVGDVKVAAARLDEVAEITGVGIVEDFHASAERIATRIRAHVPQFDFGKDAKNQTLRIDDWKDELQRLEGMLPKDLLVRMVTLNASDFALYHRFHS